MNILSPSLLSIDFNHIERNAKVLDEAGVKWFHLDVMDGTFVRNISFGPPVIKCIRKVTDSFFDVHLMITDPIRYIKDFAECGADGITFHLEAADHVDEVIDRIHSLGLKVGLSIKPSTPLEEVYPYLPKLDTVLVMSVEPGFGGQAFMDEAYGRIAELRKYINSHCLPVKIEVDGGIGKKNVREVLRAGADICVAGSAVFKKRSISENIAHFMEAFHECEEEAGKPVTE